MQFALIPEKEKIFVLYSRFRWAAIILITSTILYLIFIAKFEVPLLPSLTILAAASIYNAAYSVIFPRHKVFQAKTVFTYMSGTTDFIFLTLLIHLTGGVESPLILLYLLELVAATIFGFVGLAYLLAIEATLFYTLNCLLEAFFIIPHYRLSDLCGTLFLNFNYIFSIGFALFVTCLLLISMTSYLARLITEKQKQLEELSNTQIQFLTQVIHETKSPLTSIIGYADIFLRGSFGQISKEQETPLHIIKRQAGRILNMTNNLLDLARIEAGSAEIEKKPVYLSEIIERVIEEMKPQLDEKNLATIQELDPHLSSAPMDEAKIFVVLTNLLSNAVKFSRSSGKIFVSTQLLEKEIQISVRDEGIGIDPEDLPHIFDKFHRAAGKEAAFVRGTGLGLALCKSIVEAHGGRIWAVSGGPDKGAVFYFTLPL
jgi:signal transduction histidine kinase